MSRDSEVAAIDVIDQRGEGQQRDYPVYRARTGATLVVNWEGQVLSVDILSICPGTGKQLLGGEEVVAGLRKSGRAEEEPGMK